MANIEIMSKRVEFIGTMKDSLTVIDDESGEEVPYFSPIFLILKYLKMSEADLELNEKYKMEEKLAKMKNGDTGLDENPEDEEETSGEENGGGEGPESDEGNGDIDDEMLGDVQPESTETTQA